MKGKLKLVVNSIVYISLFLIYGFIHEFGHVLFGLIDEGDQVYGVGAWFLEEGNIFSFSFYTDIEYDLTTPNDLMINFISGYIFLTITCSLVLLVGYKKKNKILVFSSWITLLLQFIYMVVVSFTGTGDFYFVYYILDFFKVDYNVLQFTIPILIVTILYSYLIFPIRRKLYLDVINREM